MNSTIPAELLKLKTRFDYWRANRKYDREPIPDELRLAVLEMIQRIPPSLIRKILKVEPSRLNKKSSTGANTKRVSAPKKKPRTSLNSTQSDVEFFKLPTVDVFPVGSCSVQTSPESCRLQFERPDGSRLTLTLPTFDSLTINRFVADFLRGSGRVRGQCYHHPLP